MALLSLILIGTSCEEQIDTTKVRGENLAEVSLCIAFADEVDGYSLSASPVTKATASAFGCELQPSTATRGTITSKPDKLYNLEIVQYDSNGMYKNRTYFSGETTIGTALTLTLNELPDCQLVIVAWGDGNATTLGTKDLSDAQKVSLDASIIKNIPTDNMNKMPYVLHLEHVKVENNTIKSLDSQDVRILLKRLAAQLTLNWSYNVSGDVSDYELKQILLQSIPLNYKVVANPDKNGNNTYPSLLDQYTTIQLTAEEIKKGSYSCWIPANVRGTNIASNSALYRIKSNAPTGSVYVSFIADNKVDTKKKLNYRVYLGGRDYSDFNLYGNTDYVYSVTFKHSILPVNDFRVTIIDPVPASVNNNNLLPTANCFMVAPGGAFCFNPYTYYMNGKVSPNTTLQGWCTSSKIQSVKVLWQTKENGDVGDPGLGTINSLEDHTNIVDIIDKDDFEKARIYCRVAPNTTGGSGMIAAYDGANGAGNILWSWHIWVTNYNPSATADTSVDDPDKRVQKYTHGNHGDRRPMMDRNLGAMAGYIDIPKDEVDRSKANGFHYQWGRKDPFPSSYTNEQTSSVTINSDKPTPMMLNLYKPDGISFFVRTYYGSKASRRVSCQNPTAFYKQSATWCSEGTDQNWWGGNGNKAEHDPCPAGWRVASKTSYLSFFVSESYAGGTNTGANEALNISNKASVVDDGGALIYFEGTPEKNGRRTYVRLTGYQEQTNKFNYIGNMTNVWCRECNGRGYALDINDGGKRSNISVWEISDAHPVRCAQDRE